MFDLIRICTNTSIGHSEQNSDAKKVVSVPVLSPAVENAQHDSFQPVPKTSPCSVPSSAEEKPFFLLHRKLQAVQINAKASIENFQIEDDDFEQDNWVEECEYEDTTCQPEWFKAENPQNLYLQDFFGKLKDPLANRQLFEVCDITFLSLLLFYSHFLFKEIRNGRVFFDAPNGPQSLRRWINGGHAPSAHFFYLPRIAVFLPNLHFPDVELHCPKCKVAEPRGKLVKLVKLDLRGWPDAPRMIYSLKDRFALFQVFENIIFSMFSL
jgi:hypothetical protein